MLAIRLQRTGRKGHAQFRVIVQEARRSPSSGNIVMALGNYDPHTKVAKIDTEKAGFYLTNGAQPSPRVAMLLQKEGVKLPSWVSVDTGKHKSIKNVEKLRRNRPAGEVPKVEVASETTTEAEVIPTEVAAEEAPKEELAAINKETTSSNRVEEPTAEVSEEATEASSEA